MAEKDDRKICFVVMGFGKKPAYGKDKPMRTLDLDATYEAIIKPAVEGAGLRCIRADEMLNSGTIDTRMYEMLLRADLVIADISTGNVNAVYELGVRHALKPRTTVIMLEDQADFSFDLNHISTFTYRHMGDDIGSREAGAKKEALQRLIAEVMAKPTRDSPVYEFLKGLREPHMSEEDYQAMLTVLEEQGDQLAQLVAKGREAMKADDFDGAIESFGKALAILQHETAAGDDDAAEAGGDPTFVIQQLALATYKAKKPDGKAALERALEILSPLNPDESHEPETLGIAGAIHKRLEKATRAAGDDAAADRHLDRAIALYGRGFDLQHDYYNGENYALLLDLRASRQQDEDEAQYDRMTARKTRKRIVEVLQPVFDASDFADRPENDRMWMRATMANCLFALGRDPEAETHEKRFLELATAEWERETYARGKTDMLALREHS
jgi:tetratricopeptide (TPR) repeat protein